MRRLRFLLPIAAAGVILGLHPALSAQQPRRPALAQYLKPGLPLELVSARRADRVAWISYEEGKRNVYTAVAPLFKPVKATSFTADDGVDMTEVRISDDGGVVAFVRGSAPNNDGWLANPSSDPGGGVRQIWVAKTAVPGKAWKIADGNAPELSPDGRFVLYVKDGQIYRARVTPGAAANAIDKGEKPFINEWGRNSGPKWSPDSSKIVFSSNRTDHSFIGVYDMKTQKVLYLAPSVDRDTNPTWSPDGKSVAFLRRPGLPFGQQETPGRSSGLPANGRGGRGGGGGGGLGALNVPGGGRNGAPAGAPGAPAATSAAPTSTGATQGAAAAPPATAGAQAANAGAPDQAAGRQGGRGRGNGGGRGQANGGGNAAAQGANAPANANSPGLYRAALQDGASLALMVVDIASPGTVKEKWHTTADDRMFGNINNIQWQADQIAFPMNTIQGDEWERWFSISLTASDPKPVKLTTTDGIIEDATAATFSKDGKTLYYCTNASDIDRRHIWSVPTGGGTPVQVTVGEGIENVPVVLSSGKQIAVLSADAKRPMSVGLWPATPSKADAQKVIYPTLGADFPMSEEVVPTNVMIKSDDGMEIHNQLFLPKNMKPGEKHPAMVFVHGGPQRQMLLGWHYLNFYHVFYGVNQWLASQGYIVLSVNYRSGVGYGHSFTRAPNVGARGNAEYKDVLAAGKWLAARDDVDTSRLGIWGLSYGGLLTAEALSRNSDIFKAGIDLAGVHLEGQSIDPNDVSYTSSAASAVDGWKSPVLLIQGDDDRNVNFSQMVGMVSLLRARNVYYELIVYPDDVHETLIHGRWLNSFAHMEAFLNKFFGDNTASKGGK
jgi:dipeptidyl aminopeptidase/acylaminoacyl peptidase